MRSVLITKLRTKTSQNTAELDYKIDTSIDDNLMPLNMFKTLLPRTPITELNKNIKNQIACV